MDRPLDDVDRIVTQRKQEADQFYAIVHPPKATAEEKEIQRQALAGMLWGKQIYLWDVNLWLEGDNPNSPWQNYGKCANGDEVCGTGKKVPSTGESSDWVAG